MISRRLDCNLREYTLNKIRPVKTIQAIRPEDTFLLQNYHSCLAVQPL